MDGGVAREFARGSRARFALVLFPGVFAVHLLSPVGTQGDSRWTIPMALSLIHDGDADLREFAAQIEAHQYYAIECVTPDNVRRFPIVSLADCPEGALRNFHPVAVAVLVTPMVWGWRLLFG